jgi:hypothetical protein
VNTPTPASTRVFAALIELPTEAMLCKALIHPAKTLNAAQAATKQPERYA